MALNLMALRIRASPDTTGIIDDIRYSLREATRELRSFSDLLHPVKAQGSGFDSTLQRCLDGFAMRTELRVKFRGTGTVDELPPAVQELLQRMVQEALANVERYASSASRVTVKLSRLRQRLHLVIADDGKGVRKEHPPTDDMEQPDFGVSIPGMKALARQLGGRLHIRSRSTGTMVHAVVPIRR
jgi:signal transduction histidine kinase